METLKVEKPEKKQGNTDAGQKKPRIRNFLMEFPQQLTSKALESLLESLSNNPKFAIDFPVLKKIKIDEEVSGLLISDKDNVQYTIDQKSIQANSNTADDKTVVRNLNRTSKKIAGIFGFKFKKFKYMEGLDYLFLENAELKKVINEKFLEELKNSLNTEAIQISFAIFKESKTHLVNIYYQNKTDTENKKLLIEAPREDLQLIEKIVSRWTK